MIKDPVPTSGNYLSLDATEKKRNIHSVYGSLSNFYFQQTINRTQTLFQAWVSLVSQWSRIHLLNAGDLGSTPGLGRFPGKGNGNPLQDSCPEIPRIEEPGGLQSTGSQRASD